MLKGKEIEPIALKTPYQKWAEAQGVPIINDFYIEDLKTVPLEPWAWRGGHGVIINLIGTGDVNEAYVSEISPGGKLNPLRMMYEETVFVVEGSGSTSIWNDEKKKVTFEWGPGAIFAPPLNTWRQHYNASGTKPARLLVVTSAPPIMSLFRDPKFVFENYYAFNDRFDADAESFSGSGVAYERRGRHVWDTNVVSDDFRLGIAGNFSKGRVDGDHAVLMVGNHHGLGRVLVHHRGKQQFILQPASLDGDTGQLSCAFYLAQLLLVGTTGFPMVDGKGTQHLAGAAENRF